MAPNLLLYPVSDIEGAPTGVAYRKVLDPTAQDRIDLVNHTIQNDTPSQGADIPKQCDIP
jgi:hypothetical protein